MTSVGPRADRPRRPLGAGAPPHGGRCGPTVAGVAACAVGVLVLLWLYGGAAREFPGAALTVAALLAVPLAVGVPVLRRLRTGRALPRRWCWAAAVWGMTAAAGCAVPANAGLLGLWSRLLGPEAAARWGAALTAPLNEELLKLGGVALLALAVPRLVRGPLDGFALGALVGLGFQTTETWSHALRAAVESAGLAPTGTAAATAVGRLLLVGAGSHVAISAVAGAAVGLLAARRLRTGAPGPGGVGDPLAGGAAALVALALAMHAVLNAPTFATGAGPVAKALVNCLLAAALHQLLRRRLGTVLRGGLRDLGVPLRAAPAPGPATGPPPDPVRAARRAGAETPDREARTGRGRAGAG